MSRTRTSLHFSAQTGLQSAHRRWASWNPLGAKYPASIKLWQDHWDELTTMYKYPEQIPRIICLTNAIENINRHLRKVPKTKRAFASDDALLKHLYLVMMQVTDEWTMQIMDWGSILMRLMVFFDDRVGVVL